MDENIKKILNSFYSANKNLCEALRQWLTVKAKDFTLLQSLNAIYEFCDGKTNKMKDVLTQFRDEYKEKKQGRSQVYADKTPQGIDIVKDNNGKLTITGYSENRDKPLKGQKHVDNPKIFTKKGVVNKNFKKSEEKFVNIGQRLRNFMPNASAEELKKALIGIHNFGKRKKMNYDVVMDGLENGKYRLTKDFQVKNKISESKTVIINEDIAEDIAHLINDEIKMSEYKFNSNIKQFLHDLLVDPVNADTTFILKANGLDRKRTLDLLMRNKMLEKIEKISDKNEDGSFKTAVMKVKFRVPKKNFKHNLKKL